MERLKCTSTSSSSSQKSQKLTEFERTLLLGSNSNCSTSISIVGATSKTTGGGIAGCDSAKDNNNDIIFRKCTSSTSSLPKSISISPTTSSHGKSHGNKSDDDNESIDEISITSVTVKKEKKEAVVSDNCTTSTTSTTVHQHVKTEKAQNISTTCRTNISEKSTKSGKISKDIVSVKNTNNSVSGSGKIKGQNGSVKIASSQNVSTSIRVQHPGPPGVVSKMAPMLLMNNLPYMGELTFDNRPRRGRKPKKADICHLISKNYGIHFPNAYLDSVHLQNEHFSSTNSSSPPPPPSTGSTPRSTPTPPASGHHGSGGSGRKPTTGTGDLKLPKKSQNHHNVRHNSPLAFSSPPPDLLPISISMPMPQLMFSAPVQKQNANKRASNNGHNKSSNTNCSTSTSSSSKSLDFSSITHNLPPLMPSPVFYDEPLNLCLRDKSTSSSSMSMPMGSLEKGHQKSKQDEQNQINNNHMFTNFNLKRINNSCSGGNSSTKGQRVQNHNHNQSLKNGGSGDAGGGTIDDHFTKRKSSSLLSQGDYSNKVLVSNITKNRSISSKTSGSGSGSARSRSNNNNNNIECDNNIRPTLSSTSTSTSLSSKKNDGGVAVGKKRRSTLFIPPSSSPSSISGQNHGQNYRQLSSKSSSKNINSSGPGHGSCSSTSSTSTTPAAEVSICKFKFTGGAKPTLQEKKMLSVDAGGNFRFYSDKGSPGSGSSGLNGSSSGSLYSNSHGKHHGGQSNCFQTEVASCETQQLLPKSAKSMSMCMSQSTPRSSDHFPSTTTSLPSPTSNSNSKIMLASPTSLSHSHNSSISTDEGEGSDLDGDGEDLDDEDIDDIDLKNYQQRAGSGGSRGSPSSLNAEALMKLQLKRKRRTRKSLMREKLEKTFKEKGFLIQTQQLESAEGATYCKFRQLRKFTRYLFRSWKDYLPENVAAAGASSSGAGGNGSGSGTSDVNSSISQQQGTSSKGHHFQQNRSAQSPLIQDNNSSLSSFTTTSSNSCNNSLKRSIKNESPDEEEIDVDDLEPEVDQIYEDSDQDQEQDQNMDMEIEGEIEEEEVSDHDEPTLTDE